MIDLLSSTFDELKVERKSTRKFLPLRLVGFQTWITFIREPGKGAFSVLLKPLTGWPIVRGEECYPKSMTDDGIPTEF